MKPGIKTTEFWITTLTSVIIATASQLNIDLDPSTTTSIAAMVITYTCGRVMHKHPKRED